jgi:hypothetical protein
MEMVMTIYMGRSNSCILKAIELCLYLRLDLGEKVAALFPITYARKGRTSLHQAV